MARRKQRAPDISSEWYETSGTALRSAVGQLTLIEHCLCPLDARKTLRPNFVHETSYAFSQDGKRRRASVRVSCPGGLSAEDEFYLWGLLSLTLSQNNSSPTLHATRHYCLRQLGKIDSRRRGGRQYQQIAASLERLSQVRYCNDGFYDPVRGEHRRVSFGFLSYSLPQAPSSSRAWQIAWDPIFFDFCLAARSLLTFDFSLYRELEVASRRLFLLLQKLFWRYRRTPPLEVRTLGIDVLGFSQTLTPSELMARIGPAADRLAELRIVASRRGGWFRKVTKGRYVVRFSQGSHFERHMGRAATTPALDSPLVEPLKSIGFEPHEIPRIIGRYSEHLVRQWSDVTLAALENKGPSFFKRSPQAYFMHYVQQAAQGTRTPPDWWLELKNAEKRVADDFGAQSTIRRARSAPIPAANVLERLVADGAVELTSGTKA